VSLTDWLLPSEGRLSRDDVGLLAKLSDVLPATWRLGLIAPARSERRALPRYAASSMHGGDLALRPAGPYDALFAVRLPGYASSAERPFRTALRACRLLGVLDSSSASEAPTEALLGYLDVAGGKLRLYRGERCDPLLRIDDYPTGVRPILEDLSSLHDVLRCVDASTLQFHLGVVPALVDATMAEFLRSLRHLVVSMHGFEHGYAKYSKILREASDPFNQRGTVGGFDEFEGQSVEQIQATLREGQRLLESRTGQKPLSYIPPTNKANRRTGRALEACGFEYVLSEKPLGGNLPVIASDFYDRSPKLAAGAKPRVASLHATWEADLWREGDQRSLPRFLEQLLSARRQAREQVARAAEQSLQALGRG
jgi:Uncharacterized protein conserved in bacteria (DUF2334)